MLDICDLLSVLPTIQPDAIPVTSIDKEYIIIIKFTTVVVLQLQQSLHNDHDLQVGREHVVFVDPPSLYKRIQVQRITA